MAKRNIRVLFLTEAGKEIGMGHLSRSLALARELSRRFRAEINFLLVGDGSGGARIKREKFGRSFMKAGGNAGIRLDEVKHAADKARYSMLIVDTYNVNPAYLKALRTIVPFVVLFDDFCSLNKYPVDVLINYNIYAGKLQYKKTFYTECLLGPRFAPLRNAFCRFARKKKTVKKKVKEIIVTMGGADARSQTLKVVRALKSFGGRVHFSVILGPAAVSREKIWKEIGNDKRFSLVVNPPHVERYFWKADLAICGSGVTTYELAALGVPMITIVLAENQRLLAQSWADKGVAVNLGWYNKIVLKHIIANVKKLHSFKVRRKMSLAARKEVNFYGIRRLAERIVKSYERKERQE